MERAVKPENTKNIVCYNENMWNFLQILHDLDRVRQGWPKITITKLGSNANYKKQAHTNAS